VVKEDSDRLSGLRHALRERLGNDRFELWLGPQTALEFDGGVLRVRCSSLAEANWLRRRLQTTVQECCVEAFGQEVDVRFDASTGRPAPVATASPLFEQAEQPARPFSPTLAAEPPVAGTPIATANSARPQRQTFADFVIGDGNRAAAQAAREAMLQPGRFTPLLVYGPPGSGKSHLLSAMACQLRVAGPRRRSLHITAELLTTQFLDALHTRTLPSFRQKMRSLDAILIDNVRFFDRKKATLDELLYTIDALHSRQGQVVMTCDRPPADLHALSPNLAAQISAGLAVGLELPDYATRLGIVRAMAHRMQIPLSENVVELVAQRVVGSARLLSGALNRLVASSMALTRPITVELAGPTLDEFCQQHTPKVKLADIQRAVCEVFGVDATSLKSPRKTRSVADPRMLAMWLARRYTRSALSEIGDFFGNRSHSTVVSAQRKFDGLVSRRENITVDGQACAIEEAVRRIEAVLRTA
jgi:chromosomal replication initiator protein